MTNPRIQSALLSAEVEQVQQGKLSLIEMLKIYEARFTEIEPEIQSFIAEDKRFERLYREAEALEAQYPKPENRPPLYGVLVGIKDIFHVDGFITRAGTSVPPENFAGAEAAVVRKLKTAGALIAGKTVTTEFAFFEPGPTRNPHNLNHTPGGSSSGSAAAVAAGLVHIATGTQTVGSVIRPAAYCGTVGYKPSFDRIDSAGLVYFSRSADHVGLFAQDVAGLKIAASVVVNDWDSTISIEAKPFLAVPEGAYLQQSTALDEFEAHIKTLESAGYTVKRIAVMDDIGAIADLHTAMISAELAQEHKTMFAAYENLYRPRTAALIRDGQKVTPAAAQAGRDNRLKLRESLQHIMRENDIDAWICPPAPDVAPEGINATGNPAMNMPWTHAGMPAVTVPAGMGKLGLPLGLQICAAFGDDERLLAWSQQIETVFG